MDVPKSLGIEREGYGEGITKEEALKDWLNSDEFFDEQGSGDGYWGESALDTTKNIEYYCTRKPNIPKRCKVDIKKQSGSRKWITKHGIYSDKSAEALEYAETKALAIARARELAVETDDILSIRIEKHLESGEALEATIEPKEKTPGRWKFRASFKW